MPVKFYTPRLRIKNIVNKAVAIFDEYRVQPGETVDVFEVFDPLTIEEDRILKALEKPWGDFYQEVVIKKSLEIVELDLPSFHYNVVSPSNLTSVNIGTPGQIPSYLDDERFEWIGAGGVTVTLPLNLNGNVISLPPASATTDGYLTKEDYSLIMAGVKKQQKIWQYQDFSAPLGSSLTLSAFQNGSGLTFNGSYIVPDSAVIVTSVDQSKPPTATTSIPGRWLPSNRVEVTSHTGTTVVLNQVPDSGQNCRVWFLASVPAAVSLPVDYVEAPRYVSSSSFSTLDDIYLNQEGAETIYGIKTFESRPIFNSSIQIPLGASDGYILTSDAVGVASWSDPLDIISDIFTVGGGRGHSKATNIYLRTYDGATTLSSPFTLPFDCRLVAMSASAESTATWTAEVHMAQVLVSGASLSLTSQVKKWENKSVLFSAGDQIQLYCNGSNIPFPRVDLFFLKI